MARFRRQPREPQSEPGLDAAEPSAPLPSDEFWNFRLSFTGVAILLSILINAALLASLYFVRWQELPPLAPESVATRVLKDSELQQLIARAREARQRPIVQSQAAPLTAKPKDLAPYLSDRTQRVGKQTVAPQFGSTTGGLKSGDNRVEKPAARPKNARERLEKLGLSGGVGAMIRPLVAREDPQPDPGKGPAGDGKMSHGSHDLLNKDVAIGADTLLNTDEYVYASFYNRLKSEAAARWEPIVRRIIEGRGARQREGLFKTDTRFTLDSDGSMHEVLIEAASGDSMFDEAARTALLQLLRIENPPAGLRESDGRYRIRLGFIVNLEKSGLRMQYEPDPRLLQPAGSL